MSWLYRPTPVVRLGNGRFSSWNTIPRLPGAQMQGIPAGASRLGAPAPTGAALRMRRVDTRRQPFIKTSGTMGSFMPWGMGGMGQDSGDGSLPSDFFSGATAAPVAPSVSPIDLSAPSFQPSVPVDIGIAEAPLPGLPSDFFSGANVNPLVPTATAQVPVAPSFASPVAPAGAGPTGTGIPGTQPVSPVTTAVSATTSILNSIKSFFSPTPKATPYTTLPGYSAGIVTTPASVLPGVSNTMLLVGGAAIVLLLAMSGGKK
jgi:hypothetical protein